MGYLQLAGPADLSKVVISFWFRVPQETMQAVSDHWNSISNDPGNSDFVLSGIVSLLSWGPTTTSTLTSGSGTFTGTAGPSFIGLSCSGFPASLAIRLQSNNSSTLHFPTGERQEPNFFAVGIQDSIHIYTIETNETSDFLIEVSSDEWHHLIVSYDASGPQGKMWIALDDKNYNHHYLWPAATINMNLFEGVGGLGGPNDITATYDWPIYHYDPDTQFATSGGFTMADSPPLGVPIQQGVVSHSLGEIEMAELQIFTGVTVDTSSVDARRVFLAPKKDSEGNESGSLKPVDPQKAKDWFGIKPAILLHGQQNWIDGNSTGSLGVDSEGNKIDSGQFTPTGTIKKYSPDPSVT